MKRPAMSYSISYVPSQRMPVSDAKGSASLSTESDVCPEAGHTLLNQFLQFPMTSFAHLEI